MSVASDIAPIVVIPPQARPTDRRARRAHLRLVAVEQAAVGAPCASAVSDRAVRALSSPLRLTRRGLVALWLATALLGAGLLLTAYLSAGTAAGSSTVPPAGPVSGTVTVQIGDTLWSIATRVAPGQDPRRVVDRLRQANHLDAVSLTPGQTLNVNSSLMRVAG